MSCSQLQSQNGQGAMGPLRMTWSVFAMPVTCIRSIKMEPKYYTFIIIFDRTVDRGALDMVKRKGEENKLKNYGQGLLDQHMSRVGPFNPHKGVLLKI